MAFIKRTQTTPSGGMLGTGSLVGGTGLGEGGQNAPSEAGTPGGWYNIQDFLNANKQDPAIASKIQEKGTQATQKLAGDVQGQIGGLSQIDAANPFSQSSLQDILARDNYSQAQSGLQQQFNPFKGVAGSTLEEKAKTVAGSELQAPSNPFAQVQSGNFQSIMDFFGQAEKPSAQYTQGMSKMDEMLLRGQKDFVKDYPTQLQEQFTSQVVNPLDAARAEREQALLGGAKSTEEAAKSWQTGLGQYVADQQKAVNDILGQQQTQEAQAQANIPDYQTFLSGLQTANPNYYNQLLSGAYVPEGLQTKDLSPIYQQYAKYTPGTGVNESTALNQYGAGNIQDYNALAQLIGGKAFGQGYQYQPGSFTFDYTNLPKLLGLPSMGKDGQTPNENTIIAN